MHSPDAGVHSGRRSSTGSYGTLSGRRRATALANRLDYVVDCTGSGGTLSGRRRATALATRLDCVCISDIAVKVTSDTNVRVTATDTVNTAVSDLQPEIDQA